VSITVKSKSAVTTTATSATSKKTTETKVVKKIVSVSSELEELTVGKEEVAFTITLSCPESSPVECSASTCAASEKDCPCPDDYKQTDGICSDGYYSDRDGDGVSPFYGDCDDEDPIVNSYADEYCDGIDNDCDGKVDEGLEGICQ